jgi:hypothetical protein
MDFPGQAAIGALWRSRKPLPTGVRATRLYFAVVLTFLGDLTLFNLYQVWVAFPHKLVESDFRIWYAAGLIGRRGAWADLYNLDVQRRAVAEVWPGSLYLPFANPPPAAWLMVPFTLMPFGAALLLWTLLSVALIVGLSQLLASRGTAARFAFGLSAVGFLPVFVMVEAAPLSPVVIAAVAGCLLLLRRDRQVAAGLVLSLLIVKPNIAVLVPLAILAAGYVRAFGAWLAGTLAMGLISAVTVGVSGLDSLVGVNVTYWVDTYHVTYSLAFLLGSPAAYLVAVLVVTLLTLLAARLGRRDAAIAVAAGVAGSLLINHHLTPADFTILLITVWVCVAPGQPLYLRVIGVVLWLTGWASSIGLAAPVAIAELALLVALTVPHIPWRQVRVISRPPAVQAPSA